MPIQPVKLQNYRKVQDLEDVTPVVMQSRKSLAVTQSGWCKQHVIIWTALFFLAIILVLCVYFGVDDELSTALIYQTSFGSAGGIYIVKFNQKCGGGAFLKTSCSSLATAVLTITSTRKFQNVIGFGGAFTESAGFVFSKLSAKTQQKVVELYFGKTGIGFSLGRIHINSCDFSLSSYNYDDAPNAEPF